MLCLHKMEGCSVSRSDRLFEVINLMRRASSAVTARELADRLEVTPRTIYRDVAALQAMRVPIEGEAGIGYVLRPGYCSDSFIWYPKSVVSQRSSFPAR